MRMRAVKNHHRIAIPPPSIAVVEGESAAILHELEGMEGREATASSPSPSLARSLVRLS